LSASHSTFFQDIAKLELALMENTLFRYGTGAIEDLTTVKFWVKESFDDLKAGSLISYFAT
jgi:hypothetical protein